MANWKKLAQGAAGAAGGAGLDVSEVFSTYLYEGTGAAQTITNNIDLSTEGGMIWMKQRNGTANFPIVNTENGRTLYHFTNRTFAQQTTSSTTTDVTSFNTNGYSIGLNYQANLNSNGGDYVSWTFRKAPKFFDVQTFSTTSSSSVPITVNHNLGSVPGFYLIKRTDSGSDWFCFHRSQGATKYGALQNTDQFQNGGTSKWYQAPDSSSIYLGNDFVQNASYVAYFFAHNDGDGDFGPTGDQDIIKCGGFNSGSTDIVDVDLGFEPQWIMIKKSSTTGDWQIFDVMRGAPHGSDDQILAANSSASEVNSNRIKINPNGFTASGFGTNTDYIYIAIRRGPMAVPTSATDVFTPLLGLTSSSAPPIYQASHTIDMVMELPRFGDHTVVIDRLRGNKLLQISQRNTDAGNASYTWDYQTSAFNRYSGQSTWYVGQCFRRASGFFDVITWDVDGTGNQTIYHNLGAVPEMVWTKNRNDSGYGSGSWWIAHKDLTGWDSSNENDRHVFQDFTSGTSSQQGYHRDFTDTSINLRSNAVGGFTTSHKGVGYLFATLDGVSKVGSYTGNGSSQTIDCGFSSGARLVIIKRKDSSGDWYVWDTARGIVSGNDPRFKLNDTASEVTTDDSVDPANSGFIVNQVSATNINVSSASYIFYAVA